MSSVILPPALPLHSMSPWTPKVTRWTWGRVSSEPAGHKPPMTPSRVMSPGQTGAPDSTRPQKICLCLGSTAFFRAVVPHGGGCSSVHPSLPPTGLSVSPVHFMLKLFKILFKETVLEEERIQTIQSPSNYSLRIGSNPERGQCCLRSPGGGLWVGCSACRGHSATLPCAEPHEDTPPSSSYSRLTCQNWHWFKVICILCSIFHWEMNLG